jgi:hypothetical protein
MARGWESKAVEAQIEEGKHRAADDARAHASTEVRARQLRLESLRLSRSRILQQLDRAKHPAHREVLLKGLQAVEQELEEFPPEPNPNQ